MESAVLVLLGSLGGAAIGVFGSTISMWLKSRSDERSQVRTLFFEAAIQNYSKAYEIWSRTKGTLYPLEDYIIHMARIAEIAIQRNLTDNQVVEALRRVDSTVSAIGEYRRGK